MDISKGVTAIVPSPKKEATPTTSTETEAAQPSATLASAKKKPLPPVEASKSISFLVNHLDFLGIYFTFILILQESSGSQVLKTVALFRSLNFKNLFLIL